MAAFFYMPCLKLALCGSLTNHPVRVAQLSMVLFLLAKGSKLVCTLVIAWHKLMFLSIF
jgi:hypothetical protein